jgi:hypothetical protein
MVFYGVSMSDMESMCDCISVVMVSILALSVVDCRFEPRSSQTKDYKIGICCYHVKNKLILSAISCQEQVNFLWNDDGVHFVLDQHA